MQQLFNSTVLPSLVYLHTDPYINYMCCYRPASDVMPRFTYIGAVKTLIKAQYGGAFRAQAFFSPRQAGKLLQEVVSPLIFCFYLRHLTLMTIGYY